MVQDQRENYRVTRLFGQKNYLETARSMELTEYSMFSVTGKDSRWRLHIFHLRHAAETYCWNQN